jgi:virginiamycin B lyase
MCPRTACKLVALLVVVTSVVGLSRAQAALAHAVFVSAQPAPGARLAQSPASVRIVFSEPLNGGLSGIDLFDSSGAKVQPRSAGVDPANSRGYVLALPSLTPDLYTVIWHTVSLVDGHAYRGSYAFTVLRPDGAAPAIRGGAIKPSSTHAVPDSATVAAKSLALLGLFLLSGVVLFNLLAPADNQRAEAIVQLDRTFTRLTLAGSVLLLAGSIGQLLGVWLPAGGWGVARAVLVSRFGVWWLMRVGAALALAGCALWLSRARDRSRLAQVTAALLVGLVALTFAATSHGAASAAAAWGTSFDLVHILAAAVWIGGLLALLAAFLDPSAKQGRGQLDRKLLLRRFSVVAGMAVPAVLISGVGSGLIELDRLGDLAATPYGRALLVKSGVVALLLAVAAANALLLRPAFQRGQTLGARLRWTIAIEAILGLAVLVPASLLSVQVPSRSVDQASAVAARIAADTNPASQFSGNTQLAGQDAEVSITPGAIGINEARVEIAGTPPIRTLRLVVANSSDQTTAVTLRWAGAEKQADGSVRTVYAAPLRLSGAPGTWRATLGLPDGITSTPPMLLSITPAGPLSENGAPSGPADGWLIVVALALLGAIAIAAVRGLRRRAGRLVALSFGGAGVAAALVVGLAFAAGSPSAPHRASWGVSTQAQPRSEGDFSLWTIPTPNSGLMVPATGPDGSVWISEMDTNKLARLLPESNTIQELDLGTAYKGTMGIVGDRANQVWLAQESASAIGRFDPATGAYEEFPTPTAPSGPTGIALDGAGNVWFTEISADMIGRYDPSNHRFAEFPLPTANAAPYWLALGADGRVWFTELAGARVGVLDPATGEMQEYPTPKHERPAGIAIDQAGQIWIGTLQGSILRLDSRSPERGMTEAPAPGGSIYGVAVDAQGTVWIGTTGSAIYSLDPNTNRFRTYALPAGSGPWWPAIGRDGQIWVALGSQTANALARLVPRVRPSP